MNLIPVLRASAIGIFVATALMTVVLRFIISIRDGGNGWEAMPAALLSALFILGGILLLVIVAAGIGFVTGKKSKAFLEDNSELDM